MKPQKAQPVSATIGWKLLERIAEYYEFPSVVFLGGLEQFKHRTRKESVRFKRLEFQRKLKELFEEYYGD